MPKESSENEGEETAEDKSLVNNKTSITSIATSNNLSTKQNNKDTDDLYLNANNSQLNDKNQICNHINHIDNNNNSSNDILFPLCNNKFHFANNQLYSKSMLDQYTSYYNDQLNQTLFLNQKMMREKDSMFNSMNNKELIDNSFYYYYGINGYYQSPANWIINNNSMNKDRQEFYNKTNSNAALMDQVCSKNKREYGSVISPYLNNNVP